VDSNCWIFIFGINIIISIMVRLRSLKYFRFLENYNMLPKKMILRLPGSSRHFLPCKSLFTQNESIDPVEISHILEQLFDIIVFIMQTILMYRHKANLWRLAPKTSENFTICSEIKSCHILFLYTIYSRTLVANNYLVEDNTRSGKQRFIKENKTNEPWR